MYLSLARVARTTGQPVSRLRRWCATGELSCERERGAWVLAADQLSRVDVLTSARTQGAVAGHAMALAVPTSVAASDLALRVERDLDLAPGVVATMTLALDGQERVVAVWPAAAVHSTSIAKLARLADELGGELFDAGRISR